MIKQPKKEKQKGSKRSNRSLKYYNDRRWKILRNWYIRENPLCEICMMMGISKEAEHVHHRKEFLKGKTEEERYELLLDPDNLQSLCAEHHMEIHNKRRKEEQEEKEDKKESLYRLYGGNKKRKKMEKILNSI